MPENGSSFAEEAKALLNNSELRRNLIQIGEVSEDEKAWLLGQASLVLNPSVAEGFGFIPFEAASYGTPVISSRIASLHEVLPSDISAIETYSATQVAAQCLAVISDPELGASICRSLVKQASAYTWDSCAVAVRQLIEAVIANPKNPLEAIWGSGPDPQVLRAPAPDVRERFIRRIRRGLRSVH